MTDPQPDDELIHVRLRDIPLDIHFAAQEHADDLLREFQLIAVQQSQSDHVDVPRRLLALVERLTATYAGFTAEQEAMLENAHDSGQASVPEIVFALPRHAVPAALELAAMLDEADAYCRSGDYLLTLATPRPSVYYRIWYIGEFERQAAGEPPTPWPEWARDNIAE